MTLSEKFKKIKPYENDVIVVLVILFVGLIAFGLGRLSALSERKAPITVENLTGAVLARTDFQLSISDINSNIEKLFVASKNGSKYHYPWCSGAKRMKEENKIWFATKEEAEKAGYAPAANCKGL